MADIDILREALRYAAAHSHDESTQCGAVIVSGRRFVYAANQFPPGVHRPPAGDRAAKYAAIEHAERAAIYKAAACGIGTAGATLYAPWFACTDCARAIILAGIREVVGLLPLRSATPDRWEASIQAAERMLRQAGVNTRLVAESTGIEVLFDGRRTGC